MGEVPNHINRSVDMNGCGEVRRPRRALLPPTNERFSRARVNLNNFWPILEAEEASAARSRSRKAGRKVRSQEYKENGAGLDYNVENISAGLQTDLNNNNEDSEEAQNLREQLRFYTSCPRLQLDRLKAIRSEVATSRLESVLLSINNFALNEPSLSASSPVRCS